jgi:hypothetical protein
MQLEDSFCEKPSLPLTILVIAVTRRELRDQVTKL